MKNFFNITLVISLIIIGQTAHAQDFEKLSPDKEAQKVTKRANKLLQEGMELYRQKKFTEAIQSFTEALEKEPTLYSAQTNRGLSYLASKDTDNAKKDLKEVASKHPESHGALYGLSIIALMDGDAEIALEMINKALLIENRVAEYFFVRAKAYEGTGKYESALRDLNDLISKDEKPLYLIERGNIYAKIDDLESAKNDYNRVNEILNESDVANNNIMVVNSRSGDESSLDEINQKIEDSPNNSSYYTARGVYYLNANQTVKAIEDFDKAIDLDSDNVYYYINKTAALIKIGKYKEAEIMASKVIDMNPELRHGYFNRGIAREMLRDKQGACSDWEEAFLLGVDKAEEFLNSPICNE